MLDVEFKYVGQGDCILLEWEMEGDTKFGIVDCRKKDGDNPVVEHLKDGGDSFSVEFILMTHPHHDHYSGLEEVLRFCEDNNISIRLFGHTVRIGKHYIESVKRSRGKKSDLVSLFLVVQNLDEKDIIDRRGYVDDTTERIKIDDNVFIEFLSPSMAEMEEFVGKVVSREDVALESGFANLISVVTAIKAPKWYVLLTSDAPQDVFYRLGTDVLNREDRNLVLGQVPHHGSETNYSHEFWKRRRNRGRPHFASISVGPNGYGHPSEEVIGGLEDLDYNVYSTWQPSVSKRCDKARRILSSVSRAENPTGGENKRNLIYRLSEEGLDELLRVEL